MQPVLRTDTQPIVAENFGDFCHRSGRFKAEIAHNYVCFIDQDARSFFEFWERNARIDIAIIVGATHHDVGCVLGGCPEKRPDAVRRRSDLFNDFLEFLDHPAGFDHRLFPVGNFRAQIEQFMPDRIPRRQRCDHTIERIEEIARPRVCVPALKSFAALVAHYGLGQSAEPTVIITLPEAFRNLRRRSCTKCSTSMSILGREKN